MCVLCKGTGGHSTGEAALDEGFPRSSALRFHPLVPIELLVCSGNRQYNGMQVQG